MKNINAGKHRGETLFFLQMMLQSLVIISSALLQCRLHADWPSWLAFFLEDRLAYLQKRLDKGSPKLERGILHIVGHRMGDNGEDSHEARSDIEQHPPSK
jgi:hypothetical protein